MTAPVLVGVREYARHRGVSHPAVSKAIRTGRLQEAVTYTQKGSRRVAQIDVEVADREWLAKTDTRRQAPKVREPELHAEVEERSKAAVEETVQKAKAKAKKRGKGKPKQRLAFGDKGGSEATDPKDDPDRAAGIALAVELRKAQTSRTLSAAEFDRLRLQKLAGSLVEVTDVRREAAQTAHTVKAALEGIGNRLAESLAAETDPAVCARLVHGEITKALHALVDHELASEESAE